MPGLPTGTVTFLFTDIEGSTRLIQFLGDARSGQVFTDHRRLLCDAVSAAGGHVYEDQGESFLFAFNRARDAVRAAVAAQRALARHPWAEGAAVRVRMGLHTGEPVSSGEGYVGVDVHRVARICQAGYGGQILLSKTTRELVGNDLPADVSLRDMGEHMLKGLAGPERLFQVVAADLPADFPPLLSLDVFPHNLPIQLTSFVGREKEIEDVKRLLASSHLITLTGIGGSGKTRLALQAAADLLPSFPDGVWLVELASLADPTVIPQKMASVLKLREEPRRTALDVLLDYLRPRRLLLVLDNCEHLVAACTELAHTLLRYAPSLKILATSRERLAVAGEVTYPVPALSLPDLAQALTLEELRRSEAIRLFAERAAHVRPGFQLTEENARAVAQICDALDGIPLAIELAAAWVKMLPVAQIAERLSDRFRLLRATARGLDPRQQTLEATMDWSYGLLSEREQALLRRLSVFAGTFSLEAVEAICSNGIKPHDVLDLLGRLVDKSLVTVDQQHDIAPYRLLETVRQYHRQKLLALDAWETILDRHLDFYVRLAGDAERHLRGRGQDQWLALLEAEHDNLRAALSWSTARDLLTEAGVRLAGSLWWFWYIRGHYTEGRQRLALALARSAGLRTPARVKALYAAAYLAWRQGDAQQAELPSRESLALAEELGDDEGLAFSLLVQGILTRSQHRYEDAAALHERSLAVFRKLGHEVGIAWSLRLLGIVETYRGNYQRAGQLFEESRGLFETLGDVAGIASSLYDLGRIAAFEGDDARAVRLLQESLNRFQQQADEMGMAGAYESLGSIAARHLNYTDARSYLQSGLALYAKLGDRWGAAAVRAILGRLSVQEGDYAGARQDLLDSLRQRIELGDKRGIAECFEGLAELAAAVGQPERAVRLFGAAERLRENIRAPLPPADRRELDRSVAAARVQLDDATFSALWAHGHGMTLEGTLEYALASA